MRGLVKFGLFFPPRTGLEKLKKTFFHPDKSWKIFKKFVSFRSGLEKCKKIGFRPGFGQ